MIMDTFAKIIWFSIICCAYEAPAEAPHDVRVLSASPTSFNVTWRYASADSSESMDVEGFYVEYEPRNSMNFYPYSPRRQISEGLDMFQMISGLSRSTDYRIVVQAYNRQGAGPPSDPVFIKTTEYDPPGEMIIHSNNVTSDYAELSWEFRHSSESPVEGYSLHYRLVDGVWKHIEIHEDERKYTLRNLLCGTSYNMYVTAFNSAGRSNASNVLTLKTQGGPPVAPEKHVLLSVNSTSATVNLASWNDGGCPIVSRTIKFKAAEDKGKCTGVSNNVDPEQNETFINELDPGTWYVLFLSARNEAGSTYAEYDFATVTLSGEYPLSPSEIINRWNKAFWYTFHITVPLICFASVFCTAFLMIMVNHKMYPSRIARVPGGKSFQENKYEVGKRFSSSHAIPS